MDRSSQSSPKPRILELITITGGEAKTENRAMLMFLSRFTGKYFIVPFRLVKYQSKHEEFFMLLQLHAQWDSSGSDETASD